VFGTTTQAWGVIENEERTEEVQESELTGGDGDIIAVDQHGKKITVTFDYTYRAAGGASESDVGSGTAILSPETSTIIYVRSASRTHSKAPGYRTDRIEGTRWPDLLS
jgi:hypothetical protein